MTSFLRANAPWSRLVARGEIVPSELAPGATLTLDGGISITPFAVPHRDEDSDTVGFKIRGPRRTIVYVPDTDRWSAWSTPLPEVLEGCDVALLDGTFFAADELPGRDPASIGHPLITATMDLLQAAVRDGRLRVLFTHLNHSNQAVEPGSPPRREIEGRGFGVAEDGQRLPL